MVVSWWESTDRSGQDSTSGQRSAEASAYSGRSGGHCLPAARSVSEGVVNWSDYKHEHGPRPPPVRSCHRDTTQVPSPPLLDSHVDRGVAAPGEALFTDSSGLYENASESSRIKRMFHQTSFVILPCVYPGSLNCGPCCEGVSLLRLPSMAQKWQGALTVFFSSNS